MNAEQLLALASLYDDRANAAETDELVAAWSLAATELRAAAHGRNAVELASIANGFCPECGEPVDGHADGCVRAAEINEILALLH